MSDSLPDKSCGHFAGRRAFSFSQGTNGIDQFAGEKPADLLLNAVAHKGALMESYEGWPAAASWPPPYPCAFSNDERRCAVCARVPESPDRAWSLDSYTLPTGVANQATTSLPKARAGATTCFLLRRNSVRVHFGGYLFIPSGLLLLRFAHLSPSHIEIRFLFGSLPASQLHDFGTDVVARATVGYRSKHQSGGFGRHELGGQQFKELDDTFTFLHPS